MIVEVVSFSRIGAPNSAHTAMTHWTPGRPTSITRWITGTEADPVGYQPPTPAGG
jgi:hypothetical protein